MDEKAEKRPDMSLVVEWLDKTDPSEFNVKKARHVEARKPRVPAPDSNEDNPYRFVTACRPVPSGPVSNKDNRYKFLTANRKKPKYPSVAAKKKNWHGNNEANIKSFTPKRGARGTVTKETIFWC